MTISGRDGARPPRSSSGSGSSSGTGGRSGNDLEDIRSASPARSYYSEPRRPRGYSIASTSSIRSTNSDPSGRWRDAFVQLRDEIGENPSQDDMNVALRKFLDNLPSFYASAAIDFVKDMSTRKQTVNLDGLAEYFAKLDQSAAEARRLPLATPPPVMTRSPVLKRSPHSLKATSLSPSALSAKSFAAAPESDRDHFADFAPSRPHVSNLLLSDGERSPPPPAVSCPPP